MVRRQADAAVEHIRQIAALPDSPFSNLSINFSPDDLRLIALAGWMHDVGKASATTVDGKPWSQGMEVDPTTQKIAAHAHEQPFHFEPMMGRLGARWQRILASLSPQDRDDLWFVITHHMSLKQDQTGQPLFPKKLVPQITDADGKFLDERRVKMLLVVMMMDQGGRIGHGGITGIDAMKHTSGEMQTALQRKQPAPPTQPQKAKFTDPATMARYLTSQGLSAPGIAQAMSRKFGKIFSPEEITQMVGTHGI